MPIDQARSARGAVAMSDGFADIAHDQPADPDAHIAQTIDPAADGCRTIVLTVDPDASAATGPGRDPSILDGGLETTWVMPARGRRFGREDVASSVAAPEEAVVTLGLGPATETIALPADEASPASDLPPADRPRASFHAQGDDAAVARVEADRLQAGRRHAERRRRRAEATVATETATPARRRSGPAPRPAQPAAVQRHTVRVTGSANPLLVGTAGTAGVALERRRPSPVALNPIAGLIDRPDRIAMWAVLLGIFLVLVAATSG